MISVVLAKCSCNSHELCCITATIAYSIFMLVGVIVITLLSSMVLVYLIYHLLGSTSDQFVCIANRYLLCFLCFQEKFTPAKYFSIDRVFRNETLDATHLAEFHQIEGVVADYDLTLGHLIGILYAFFKKLGQWILVSGN